MIFTMTWLPNPPSGVHHDVNRSSVVTPVLPLIVSIVCILRRRYQDNRVEWLETPF